MGLKVVGIMKLQLEMKRCGEDSEKKLKQTHPMLPYTWG